MDFISTSSRRQVSGESEFVGFGRQAVVSEPAFDVRWKTSMGQHTSKIGAYARRRLATKCFDNIDNQLALRPTGTRRIDAGSYDNQVMFRHDSRVLPFVTCAGVGAFRYVR